MDKQFSGFIKWKGNLTTIVSKRDNKETIFREIIVSTDEQHPTSMLITFWGDLARQLDVAVPNQRISVDFDITAIEYVKDGKSFYKNNIKGWRFALGAVDVQPNWVVSSAYCLSLKKVDTLLLQSKITLFFLCATWRAWCALFL